MSKARSGGRLATGSGMLGQFLCHRVIKPRRISAGQDRVKSFSYNLGTSHLGAERKIASSKGLSLEKKKKTGPLNHAGPSYSVEVDRRQF